MTIRDSPEDTICLVLNLLIFLVFVSGHVVGPSFPLSGFPPCCCIINQIDHFSNRGVYALARQTGGEREITADTLFDGRLRCCQHRDGYRFSVDSILLAHFSSPRRSERVLDLGCGCGVVSLIMAFRHPNVYIDCLEIQPALAGLARKNAADNGFSGRMRVFEGDMRDPASLPGPRPYDRVVCNPPYRRRDGSRISRDPEQAAARHEINIDLDGVIAAADRALGIGGRLDLVYPASRGAHLFARLGASVFEPKRLQVVHSYPGSPGKIVLVEAMKKGGEDLEILPPFFIFESPGGEYTAGMAALYR